MWFHLKEAGFDLTQFAHAAAEVMAIRWPQNTVPATSLLKNKGVNGGVWGGGSR